MEEKLEQIIVPKTWGDERWMVNNDLYCGKILTVLQNKMCSIHYHKIKDETFILTLGHVTLQIFDEYNENVSREYEMHKGDTIRIPPGTAHRFIGKESLSKIIEISTQHFDEDSYRITPAGDYKGK